MTVKVLVVDDHPMMRGALRTALETLTEDVVVVLAGSLQDAFRQLATQAQPDLVLLDLNLPDACGTATIGAFRSRAPGSRVVAVSGNYDPATVQACQAAGAIGFIPKSYSLEQLLGTIRRTLAGQTAFPDFNQRGAGNSASGPSEVRDVNQAGGSATATAAASPVPRSLFLHPGAHVPPRDYTDGRHLGLTERQRGVLRLMLLGLSNKSICKELDLAEGTVKVHVSAILRALGVSTRAQVVVAATRSGIRAEDMR
ncbi:MAG: response regulator transcription factor [Lautropia sp.]|nr:response regulator transcription factor [Lautropia sp.]